jgi:hypothetical protein
MGPLAIGEASPLFVARGALPRWLVLPSLLFALLAPTAFLLALWFLLKQNEHLFGIWAPAQLDRYMSWLIRNGYGLRFAGVTTALLVPGIGALVLIARFFAHRTGEVRICDFGVAWDPTTVRPWSAFEGYRDTPHPWIEIVETNGSCRTIPTPRESERAMVLDLLAEHALSVLGDP